MHFKNRAIKTINKCIECGKEFHPAYNTSGLYCSLKCCGIHWKKRKTNPCCICGTIVIRRLSEFRGKAATCSQQCRIKRMMQTRTAPVPKYLSRSAVNIKNRKHIYGSSCLICQFDRVIDYAHIVPTSKGGTVSPENILPLCPNHHRLFDRNKLTEQELCKISHRINPGHAAKQPFNTSPMRSSNHLEGI